MHNVDTAGIAVIGAGVVGICTALYLLRSGKQVTLIDPSEPGSGASHGNSGMISVDESSPMAMPGMLRNVPKWLMDADGPLHVKASYVPKAFPWLVRWVMESRLSAVERSSTALRSLNQLGLDCYRELLGSQQFNDLINAVGHVHLWDTPTKSVSELVSEKIREKQGIETREISAVELQELVPGISPSITRALHYPNNANAVNPFRLMKTLKENFVKDGGIVKHEKILAIWPSMQAGYTLQGHSSSMSFSKVVVAAGAWSKKLVSPLGISVPLETERGYHVQLEHDSVNLKMPLLFRSRGFSAAPMEMGLRLSGTVEIAGLHNPPTKRRLEALLKQGKYLFPDLSYESFTTWMGFRPSLPDSVPVLSESSKHSGLFMAFGHGHLGLTGGAISGKLISQMVCGKKTEIDMSPYSIKRFSE